MDKNEKQAGKTAAKDRQRSRNIALAGLLFGLVVLFYIVTIVKMGIGTSQ